jgi:hypothetical protein
VSKLPLPAHCTDAYSYFINDKDEIRSIENPKAYFKFFITKNERYNVAQREAMNGELSTPSYRGLSIDTPAEVIRNIISDRLIDLGLLKIRLPFGAKENEPNLPIFTSRPRSE